MKSTEVGQEGGTNQAKMIKIGAANGCSPPVSNLNTTHNTGMRIRVCVESCTGGPRRRKVDMLYYNVGEHSCRTVNPSPSRALISANNT